MKKNVFSVMLVFLACGFAATAQTEKGNWLVGGDVKLNTANKNTTIAFSPSAGYFIANNLAVGANVLFSYTKVNDAKTTSIGAGPFARYYFGTMNIRPFVFGDVNFVSTKTKVNSTATTSTGSSYDLGAGLAAFINRNVAIEGKAGYNHVAYEKQDGSGGSALSIGFQVYLSRAQVANLKSNL